MCLVNTDCSWTPTTKTVRTTNFRSLIFEPLKLTRKKTVQTTYSCRTTTQCSSGCLVVPLAAWLFGDAGFDLFVFVCAHSESAVPMPRSTSHVQLPQPHGVLSQHPSSPPQELQQVPTHFLHPTCHFLQLQFYLFIFRAALSSSVIRVKPPPSACFQG